MNVCLASEVPRVSVESAADLNYRDLHLLNMTRLRAIEKSNSRVELSRWSTTRVVTSSSNAR